MISVNTRILIPSQEHKHKKTCSVEKKTFVFLSYAVFIVYTGGGILYQEGEKVTVPRTKKTNCMCRQNTLSRSLCFYFTFFMSSSSSSHFPFYQRFSEFSEFRKRYWNGPRPVLLLSFIFLRVLSEKLAKVQFIIWPLHLV